MNRLNAPPLGAQDARPALRFDRNELSGAFGDIGTDFPLLVSMILIAKLDTAGVLIMFGLMQIFTGTFYRMPMPVQPLKAMAVLVITQKLSGRILYGGGLAIGIMMLALATTGLIDWVAKAVPKSVVRGIQFGLGLQLASLALKDYVQAAGLPGYGLAGASFVITLALLGNRKYPPALLVILLGVAYAVLFKLDIGALGRGVGFTLPHASVPNIPDILTGLVVLALPQLPLSLGNSILATRQVTADLFPRRAISVRKISLTYALMNLINPFLGGVPTCHGSGGIVGHYAFGARTGGAGVIFRGLSPAPGLFFCPAFRTGLPVFSLPLLRGILLFLRGMVMRLVGDTAASPPDISIAPF